MRKEKQISKKNIWKDLGTILAIVAIRGSITQWVTKSKLEGNI